jgi:NADH-quinone oxidoreductase subunit N
LLGVVLLYAHAHTLSIPEIQKVVLAGDQSSPYFWISFALVYIAIATKVSLFPFHLVTPGVFGGAPTPVAALLSVVPVLAGLGLCVKACLQVFSSRAPGAQEWVVNAGIHWPGLLAVAAATTMTLSNLLMLRQRSLKRLMALSTVVQASYLLLSIALVSLSGLGIAMFGAFVQIITTLGAYLVLMHCMDAEGVEELAALRGLVWRRPAMAVAFSAFLLSLAGLPPFAGFVSRTYLIAEVVKQQQYAFAVVVAINTVLGCVPFLGLLKLLVEDGGRARVPSEGSTMTLDVTTAVLALPTLLVGIYWDTLMISISNSLRMILW